MNRAVWAAVRCAAVNDVISSSALRKLGVASGTITNRCREGGTWQRFLPGIVLLHNGFPSTLQRDTAALLYGGDEAVLSGHASLGVQGYRASSSMSDVLILIPPHRHRAPTSYVIVERTWRMPEPVRRGSLLCAPIGRSVIDDVAMAWEIDSLQHHLSPADHEATMLRRARMRRHGIVVVEHLPKVLKANPDIVEADLWANYRLACDRPRPDVYLRTGDAA